MKKQAKRPKMTLDRLASQMERGFAAVAEDIGEIKRTMATKDELRDFRNESRERFLEINGRLVSIEQELKDIKRRLTRLEEQFDRAGAINKGEFEELWKRIAAIEKRLKMQS